MGVGRSPQTGILMLSEARAYFDEHGDWPEDALARPVPCAANSELRTCPGTTLCALVRFRHRIQQAPEVCRGCWGSSKAGARRADNDLRIVGEQWSRERT
jgi:hypothetical protein